MNKKVKSKTKKETLEIVVTKGQLDSDTGRRLLMAEITAAMFFPDKPERRMGMKGALVTQFNLDFYRAHKEDSVSGDILIGMLEHAATADMSLLESDIVKKRRGIGLALAVLFKKMLYETVQGGEPVPFWNEIGVATSEDITEAVSEKTRERNTMLFRPVLHMWAAAIEVAWNERKNELILREFPFGMDKLEKFIQYSALLLKVGEMYKQKHSSHMFFDGEKCFRFNLEGFELPEIIFTNKEK